MGSLIQPPGSKLSLLTRGHGGISPSYQDNVAKVLRRENKAGFLAGGQMAVTTSQGAYCGGHRHPGPESSQEGQNVVSRKGGPPAEGPEDQWHLGSDCA